MIINILDFIAFVALSLIGIVVGFTAIAALIVFFFLTSVVTLIAMLIVYALDNNKFFKRIIGA